LILGDDFEVGDGIFVLTTKEKNNLNLTKEELNIVKPTYTTNEIFKYYSNPKNEYWTIYTSSDLKHLNIKKYPNLKKHLDKFKNIITSDNAPHGLHRARDERFFMGEKIVTIRKWTEPIFSYSTFDCYVSATFYVIKSSRLKMKYLTGLLNSKLISFWLKNKGKMQGNNFQIDKEPILELPIKLPSVEQENKIITLVDGIIKKKVKNEATISLENEIDNLVYELYPSLSKQDIEIIEKSAENEGNNN
jgi:adenine-specific DNA-methyltransferase